MKIPESLLQHVHGFFCGTYTGTPEDGCCGCGGPEADVYFTCGYCGRQIEAFCWGCVDGTAGSGWPIEATDYFIYPGRERRTA